MSRRPPIPPLFPSPPLFRSSPARSCPPEGSRCGPRSTSRAARSEEHTSELQSRSDLVCRLLLEKKKNGSWSAGSLYTHPPCLFYHPMRGWRLVRRTLSEGASVNIACAAAVSLFFFFFKGSGAPRVFPSSPPRPSPD